MKYNKGVSSNLNSPEFHESAFFKDIDQLQEYEDVDSLTLMQMQSDQ
jgi:hypothetical protein